jgi:hypothetical protein
MIISTTAKTVPPPPNRDSLSAPAVVTTAGKDVVAVLTVAVEEDLMLVMPDNPAETEAGGAVGSGTPDGQCQWSPCGSQLTTGPEVEERSAGGGVVVGSDIPGGQCQWSP